MIRDICKEDAKFCPCCGSKIEAPPSSLTRKRLRVPRFPMVMGIRFQMIRYRNPRGRTGTQISSRQNQREIIGPMEQTEYIRQGCDSSDSFFCAFGPCCLAGWENRSRCYFGSPDCSGCCFCSYAQGYYQT